jgi:hypothetical protein
MASSGDLADVLRLRCTVCAMCVSPGCGVLCFNYGSYTRTRIIPDGCGLYVT